MITINGQTFNNLDGTSLLDYLKSNSYSLSKVAIERNGDIVPKAQYDKTIMCNGDMIEIVHFVGGG